MQSNSGFFGVYPMLYALFDGNGRLSREGIRKQVDTMIAHGVHGIAVLGLATEVNKLNSRERRTLLDWVAEDVGGRVSLSVTIAEPSIYSQAEFLKAATDAGANWAILQPPAVKGVPDPELIRFFGSVADKSSIPLGIHNAPQYLGVGLSNYRLKFSIRLILRSQL